MKMKKKILYIGGFEMPDGNAAAQRVLAVAKSLRKVFDISFLGITHGSNFSGDVDGFDYKNLTYPSSKNDWINHLTGTEELVYVKNFNPDIVVAYNFPAFGLYRITKYCKKRDIKIVGDITEWYQPRNLLKWTDTTWRMVFLNKKMDGLILISKYLKNYYSDTNSILMPPTVDTQEKKWATETKEKKGDKTITLMYAGSPGRDDKDRLDNLVECIGKYSNLLLKVVGITSDDYKKKFPEVIIPHNVEFYGRQSHDRTIELLNDSDFSVFFRRPSRVNNAGFPTKFVEAQSAGIPVVSSHFSDLEAYVAEGKNGFLANSIGRDDVDSVLSKLSNLSRIEIQAMHDYTKSQNQFDYRNYQVQLAEFFQSL